MSNPIKRIRLVSSDEWEFELTEAVAKQSKTISYLRENVIGRFYIPLPNVTAPTLKMVIEYCKKHNVDTADASKTETTEEGSSTSTGYNRIMAANFLHIDEELRNWDKQFVDVDQSTLYKLIMAANFLHIGGLLDLAIQKMSDINMKSPQEIRKNLEIKTDFTSEDKERMKSIYSRWL